MCQKHARLRDCGRISEHGVPLCEAKRGGKKPTPGPIRNGYGYILVHAPADYLGRTRDGRVLEHRLVVEQRLGRLLEDWEIVHHRNGLRHDNRPENLEVLDGRARRGEGHPSGHTPSVEDLQAHLDQLQHNDPEAYAALLQRRVG